VLRCDAVVNCVAPMFLSIKLPFGGHSTMEMVKTYLALAQADLEKNHKLASPVDNWRL